MGAEERRIEVRHTLQTRVSVLGWVTLVALTLSIPAAAQQTRVYREGGAWVEESGGSVPAASTVVVRMAAGNVSVQGGNNANISYALKKRVRAQSEADARQQFDRLHFNAGRSGDSVVFSLEAPGHWRSLSADLNVQVPRSMELVKASTQGGNESVTGINGRAEVMTAGGNIHLDDIGGAVTATSAGGNVDVGTLGGDLMLKTGGGNIHITSVKGRIVTSSGGGNILIGSATQGVSAQTGGGDIDVKQCGGELSAQTGGGTLDLGQIGGRSNLQSGGGSIRLAWANGPVLANTGGGTIELFGLTQGAQVQTGGGSIVAEFLGGNFTGSALQTPAGDIVVYLGPALKANIRASVEFADGHHIRSEFPDIKVSSEGGQYGPKSLFAEGSLNGGGPVLRLRATSGSIDIRRAKK